MLKVMRTNGKGWASVGKDLQCAPSGHEVSTIAFALESDLVQLEVGDYYDALTKSDAREINKELHALGWISETNHDLRVHPDGNAQLEIIRNFTTANGVFVRARYLRTA